MLILRMHRSGIEAASRTTLSNIKLFEDTKCDDTTNQDPLGQDLLMISINFLYGYLGILNESSHLPNETRAQIAKAFILFGVALQKKGKFSDSLDHFTQALLIFYSIGYGKDHPDVIRASQHADSGGSRLLTLVPRDSPNKICLKFAESLRGKKVGKTSLELSSHPGYAIVRLKKETRPVVCGNMKWEACFLSIALKDSALYGNYDGQVLRIVPENLKLAHLVGECALDAPISMRSSGVLSVNKERPEIKNERIEELLNENVLFSIGDDDTIYPTNAPHLCVGVAPYPSIYFVNRHSPNKAIFKSFTDTNLKK